MKRMLSCIGAGVIYFFLCNVASANVVTLGTRVIYPQADREVTVQLKNDGELPSLVQTWIDDGNIKTPVNKIKVPFVVMPPIFRIESGKGQTIRISYTGGSLPQDKESVYWLNILDVPPKGANTGENTLQMAIRSRIKIFFRPVSLNSNGAVEAYKNVKWTLTNDKKLQGENASPYFVNISSAEVVIGGKKIETTQGEMLAPGERKVFKSVPFTGITGGHNIKYTSITDYGGVAITEVNISNG